MSNKSGQAIIYGIMLFIMAFLTVIILTQPLKQGIEMARDNDHLNCTSTLITTGTKLTCLVIDLQMFYFVGMVLAAAGSYIFIGRTIGG